MISAEFLQDPYPDYRSLQEAGAIHWSEDFFGGAWLLTRYADVTAVLRDPRFSVQRVGRWLNSCGPGAREQLVEFKRIFARAMLFFDGPSHARLRKAVGDGFRPSILKDMAPRIRGIVDHLLDSIESQASADFMQDFARPLPALVIADMLDIDSADRADFIAWSDDIAAFIGSPQPTLDLALRAQSSSIALNDYFRSLLPLRRNAPGDDLIGRLIRAQGEGQVITEKELVAQCAMLLFAGHETTRNLLGNGLYWLLRHRDQWTRLRDDPQLMPAAVREMLRFDSPIQYTARRIYAEVQMHGRTLKRGQLLVPLIGAANRDPARFSDPDRFDIGRDEGMHLSFGHGPHVCIGAALTTMEAEIAFSTLMRRLPMLELASPVADWSGNPVYRGLATLPLRTNRRSAASPQSAAGCGSAHDRC